MKARWLFLVAFIFMTSLAFFLNKDKTQIIEIEEYQGEKLDSVYAFRENSIKGVQNINISEYSLKIEGLVENPIELNYLEILDYPNHTKLVTLHCVEGWNAKILWEGLKLTDLIEEVKPIRAANTIIFYAVDGYTSSLSLDFVKNNDLILAHKMNGAPLIPERGFPLQLVAESKWGYKWVKWISKIEFSNDKTYEGFWEKRGYSNSADVNSSFFD